MGNDINNKNLKISVEIYNNIVQILNELEIASGIQNATKLAQVGQLLSQVSLIDEEEKEEE